MDLFTHSLQEKLKTEAPLAARMRPRTLDEYVGQGHIIGPGKLLRRAIDADRLFASIILWGPPGTGKTTLAMCIANQTQSHFETLSAVLDGKPVQYRVIALSLIEGHYSPVCISIDKGICGPILRTKRDCLAVEVDVLKIDPIMNQNNLAIIRIRDSLLYGCICMPLSHLFGYIG